MRPTAGWSPAGVPAVKMQPAVHFIPDDSAAAVAAIVKAVDATLNVGHS